MTQDLKTKLIEEAQARFDKQWFGELNATDDMGGFDAKPYLRDFLATEIGNAVEETEKRVREEVFFKISELKPEITELVKLLLTTNVLTPNKEEV